MPLPPDTLTSEALTSGTLTSGTPTADTLVYDTAAIHFWQADAGHDYNGQLQTPEPDFLAWVMRWFNRILSELFGNEFAEEYGKWVFVVLCLLLLAGLLRFVWRRRPVLFVRTPKKQPLEYQVTEDTIYGVDFARDIEAALAREEYREAVRLLYLETLKELDDRAVIDWQPSKTPTDYVREWKAEGRKEPFRQLTNHFLRVRYGNFEADAALFQTMRGLQRETREEGVTRDKLQGTRERVDEGTRERVDKSEGARDEEQAPEGKGGEA